MTRLLCLLVLLSGVCFSQGGDTVRVGPLPNGNTLLNSGWQIRPAGQQVSVGTFPVRSLVSSDGEFLLVLHAGKEQPSVRVLRAGDLSAVDEARLEDAGDGMAFAPGGETLYVSGGASAKVFSFSFGNGGKLTLEKTFAVVPRGEERTAADYVGDVSVSPDGRLVYVACLFRNEVAVINPQSGWVIERFPTARRPYRVLLHPGGEWFYVTSWAEGSIHQHRTDDGGQVGMLRLGPQPMDFVWREKPVKLEEEEEAPPWRARLFVAVAGTNRVYSLSVSENGDLGQLETVHVALWPNQPRGMTPSALALSPDEERLYVVCSDANTVAVLDVSTPQSRVLGFLPAGWYPTDASVLPDGRLAVLNGKGTGADGNGSVSLVKFSDEAQLFASTKTVLRLTPYNDRKLMVLPVPEGSPIPPGFGVPEDMASPIRHALYVVKGGDGKASPAAFAKDTAPNQYRLANSYVLFDNYHAMGEARADGQLWSTAAIVPPFVQRLWPATAAGRLERDDYEHGDLASVPATGYLWSHAINAGLSVRNYGFLAENHRQSRDDGEQVSRIRDRSLWDVTDRAFPGMDAGVPDTERAKVFVKDLAEMEAAGEMPRLMVMRLGGGEAADTDAALGMIAEACSKSKFWPRMAVFVTEVQGDQGTSYLAPALVVSPYTRRGIIDSNFYTTASMLRTIELILGLRPMTHFDAAAIPMWPAFQSEPDTTPYEAVNE